MPARTLRRLRSFVGSIARDRRGVSAVFLAVSLVPVIGVGTVEFSRLILLTQKLQSGSFILADLTARDKTLSTEQLGNIFLALDQVIQPFEFAESGRAIVTSIGVDADDDPVVNWQCGGAGELTATSELGSAGGDASLPEDLSISAGETIIAAEVFYGFEPLFGIVLEPRVIRRVAFFKPRLGDLTTLTCPA
jgi:hypothetical protein